MTRNILILILLLPFSALAQNDQVINKKFNMADAFEVVKVIEEQTDFTCFFKEEWLKDLVLDGNYQDAPTQKVLDDLIGTGNLSYVVYGSRIIFTYNANIQREPALISSDVNSQNNGSSASKGMVFSREYIGQTADRSDLENYVFEIGQRSKLKIGETSTLAGYVKERETGNPIIGALVYTEDPFKATSTDADGFYSMKLPSKKIKILIQYVGMKTTQRNIVLFSDGRLDVDMDVDLIALQEVTIESGRDQNVQSTQMGISKINIEEIKTVPIVLGENDILKVATTKAGVRSVGEGASGFNVRGGKADQNMILINDAPVYNTSHFFGFFSVFNSDAIQSMDLFKSAIPAEYGGRLSSVFDIESKSASKESFQGSGGISPITSKLTLEIPIIKDQTSLMVGGRSTYSNWVLSNVNNAQFRDNRVSFFDVIARLDHQVNDNNSISVSSYMSGDKFRLTSDTLFSFSNFSFSNFNTAIKWDRKISQSLNSTVSAIYSSYKYDLTYDESIPNGFTQDFGLSEMQLKANFDYYPEIDQKITFGVSTKRYGINPGTKKPLGQESIVLPLEIDYEQGLETALYYSNRKDFGKLRLSGGLRYVLFNTLGERTVNQYQEGSPKSAETLEDKTYFGEGEIAKTYHGPEWRISSRYTLDRLSSIKAGLSRTRQYIHTMSNSASLSPTDTWRLSSEYLRPQVSDEISLGYYRNLRSNTLEFSIEGYYKWLQNLVDFKTGATFLLNQSIERATLQGPGKSYGLELTLTKSGRLNGWINYTYARTFIKLDGDFQEEIVNNGEFFPTNYDTPHTLNMVANYKLTRRLSFSLNSTYNTGRPVTVPVAAFDYKGSKNIHFSDRNAFRIPDYFRLDLGINLEGNHKIEKLSHSFWSLSIYNLTGRDNPFSVFFDIEGTEIRGSQLVVFGNPIPTISYNFEF
ncbi:MAG: TonB-dependent receptor [Cyclobacteriaceae bacterium]